MLRKIAAAFVAGMALGSSRRAKANNFNASHAGTRG
jgi:hypothetical protein